MSVPGSINPQVAAARNAALLQMLAGGQGASLSAKVVGPAPNGLTTVTIGKETLNLSITPAPAPGSTLQLRVEGSGPAIKLTLVNQLPPPSGSSPPAQSAPAATTTSTAPPTSPAATPVPQTARSATAPQPQTSAPPSQTSGSTPTPLPQTSPGVASAQTPSAAAGARPSMPPIPLPASASPEMLTARPGTTFVAKVVGPTSSGQTEVLVGKTPLNLPIAPPPAPGGTVQVRVDGNGPAAKLVLVNQPPATPNLRADAATSPPATPSGASAPATTLARLTMPAIQLSTQTPLPAQGAATTTNAAATVTATSTPTPATPAPQPARATPAQALTQMIPAAATRQDSIAPLLANLAGLAGKLNQMPADVARPATQLLNSMVNLDKPVTGQTIQQAVARSGVFLEAKLGAATPPQGDVKSALLQLRSALTQWLGADAIAAPVNPHRPAPPTRGSIPRAQRTDLPETPSPVPAREAARPLLEQADAAIQRVRLMQLASLPDESRPVHAAERNLEIPLVLGQELSIAHLQVFRDGRAESEAAERGWQLRFSVNFSQLGEVGAHVALRGRRTSVTLWADREETAEALEEMLPELTPSLAARGLEPGTIRVRRGIPRDPTGTTGGFVDSLS